MENTPPDPDIPQLLDLLRELVVRNPNVGKKLKRKLKEDLELMEAPDKPNKEPYLPTFFFLIFKAKIEINDFVTNVLYHLRKTQLYYSFPHVQRLEAAATKYFCELYKIPPTSIQYIDKEEGKQMGAIAIITQPNGQKIKFFLKTQRKGRRREEFGLVEPEYLDTRELFVYKFLEFSNLCPEVHFFYYDANDYYIGIKDAIFDPQTNSERFICTYLQLKNSLDQKGIDFKNITEENENSIPPIIIKELTYSFLISLIFVISDTFTSVNNIIYYGRDIDNIDGFLIIDFYATFRTYDYDCSIFQAFINGCGVIERTNYKFIKYMLIWRSFEKKMNTIKEVFDPLSFTDAVEKAYDDVKKYPFVQMEVLNNERENAIKKCNEFWEEYLTHINDE